MTQKSNGGFYFSEEVGFEPEIEKKNDDKKSKGDKKDGKEGNKKTKQKR